MSKTSIDFKNLPPRVIIHDILPYHLINIPEDDDGRYSLFGYFKLDRLRHIWLLFSSVLFDFSSKKEETKKNFDLFNENFVVDISRLVFFSLSDPNEEFMAQLAKKSYRMRELMKLEIMNVEGSTNCLLFQDEISFPSLRQLILVTKERKSHIRRSVRLMSNWEDKSLKQFSRLQRLRLSLKGMKPNINFFFSSHDIFSSLKHLVLLNVECSVLTGSSRVFVKNTHQLEFLHLRFCTGLYIESCKSITSLRMESCDNESMKYHFKSAKNVNEYTVSISFFHSNGLREEGWLLDSSLNKLMRLRSLNIEFHPVSVSPDMITGFKNVSSSLNRLTLTSVDGIDDNLFEIEFPHLQYLELNLNCVVDPNVTGNVKCPFSKNLKALLLKQCNNMEDGIFSLNEWTALENLNLVDCESMHGKRWKRMNNLTRLRVSTCQGLSDGMFKIPMCFPKLGELILTGCSRFEGTGWCKSNLENLKSMVLGENSRMTDSVFQEHEFRELRDLHIQGEMGEFIGSGWRIDRMNKLRVFCVDSCPFLKELERNIREKIVENSQRENN